MNSPLPDSLAGLQTLDIVLQSLIAVIELFIQPEMRSDPKENRLP